MHASPASRSRRIAGPCACLRMRAFPPNEFLAPSHGYDPALLPSPCCGCQHAVFTGSHQVRAMRCNPSPVTRAPACRLIWEWSKDDEAAHTAVLLVSCALQRAQQPPGVLRAALTAAAATGALQPTQHFFDELRRTPGELDGQAFGLLISAYGKVCPRTRRAPRPLIHRRSSALPPACLGGSCRSARGACQTRCPVCQR